MRYIRDDEVTRQQVRPGTVRRILPYATRHRGAMALLLVLTAMDSAFAVISPLLLRLIIDDGILRHRAGVVVALSLTVAGLALADAVASYVRSWYSNWLGESLVLELRVNVFRHLQRQPLAFFTRTQTGSLVSRVNNDINDAQRTVGLLVYRSVSVLPGRHAGHQRRLPARHDGGDHRPGEPAVRTRPHPVQHAAERADRAGQL